MAESLPPCGNIAVEFVAAVRDSFAEGIAYGVEEALGDAIEGVLEGPDGKVSDLSFAAAAVLGRDAWVFADGSCCACLLEVRARGAATPLPWRLAAGRIHHLELLQGQTVVLLSGSIAESASDSLQRFFGRPDRDLDRCIGELTGVSRIRFTESGGAAAALRLSKRPFGPRARLRHFAVFSIALLAAASAALALCSGGTADVERSEEETPSHSDDVVMPLE